MVKVIENEDLFNHIEEYDVILLYADIFSTMRHGLSFDIKKKYPHVLEVNINTKYGDIDKLGTVVEAVKENTPTFCLCYINKDIYVKKKFLDKDTCQYDAIEKCLNIINIRYKNKRIASTILGASQFDGNGDKDRLLSIFNNIFTTTDIDLYDYEQLSSCKKWINQYNKGMKILKESGYTAYNDFLKKEKNK